MKKADLSNNQAEQVRPIKFVLCVFLIVNCDHSALHIGWLLFLYTVYRKYQALNCSQQDISLFKPCS